MNSLDEYPGHFFTSSSSEVRKGIRVHEAACSCGFGPYNWTTRYKDHTDHVLESVRQEVREQIAKEIDQITPPEPYVQPGSFAVARAKASLIARGLFPSLVDYVDPESAEEQS